MINDTQPLKNFEAFDFGAIACSTGLSVYDNTWDCPASRDYKTVAHISEYGQITIYSWVWKERPRLYAIMLLCYLETLLSKKCYERQTHP
jgi:hypothetical protein